MEEFRSGQLHGFVKPLLHPLAVALVQVRMQLPEVVRRFDTGKIPRYLKRALQRLLFLTPVFACLDFTCQGSDCFLGPCDGCLHPRLLAVGIRGLLTTMSIQVPG
jgi:hypothetical protein